MRRYSRGFTLIELLVVVAIIGILSAVGVVSYSGYKTSAEKKQAEISMNSIYLAEQEYKSNNGNYYYSSSISNIVNELFDGVDDLSEQNFTFSISGNANSGTLSIQAKSKSSNCTLNLNEKKNNFLLSKIPKNNKSNNEIVKLREQLENLINSSKDTNSLEIKKNIAILEKDLKILESLSESSSVKQTNLLETDSAKKAKVETGDVITSVEDIFKKDTASSKKIKSAEFSNLNFNDQYLIAPGMTAYYFYIGSQNPLKRSK